MPATLVELAANIVSSHASVKEMSTEELLQEIQKVYSALQQLETAGTAHLLRTRNQRRLQ